MAHRGRDAPSPLMLCACPVSYNLSLPTIARPWYGSPDAPAPSGLWPMCVCFCRSSAMATSDRHVSSGPPTLPTRRPTQDHGSGALGARRLPAASAGGQVAPAQEGDAPLDTRDAPSVPLGPWLGPRP